MSETYPVKADGQYAGTYCEVNKPKACVNQAKFTVAGFGLNGHRTVVCGHHLAVAVRGVQILEGRAAVIQEIPGYKTAAELVLWEKQLMTIPTAERKVIE